ncbi:MAG TPA: dihydrolipoyl dehydrogenase [bacterium]|jgi:dihydrolipoamide dehydrogenase
MVMGQLEIDTDVVIIGGGTGGYIAAIRAADLGLNVTLIEEQDRLGGVCLIEGCIPSKTLIHAVELAESAKVAGEIGLSFGHIKIDIDKLRQWTQSVVDDLIRGVDFLVSKRGIEVITGRARFASNKQVLIEGEGMAVNFKHAIIATGSCINKLPGEYDLPLWTSADAVNIPEVPESLLVIGGGYIGLELGLVYHGLGTKITMVEFLPELLAGADQDLVKVVVKRCQTKFEAIMTKSKVVGVTEGKDKRYAVQIQHEDSEETLEFDQVLVCVGRRPNSSDLGLENTKIVPDERGFIPTNSECRTEEENIFAVGDVTHGPMLAHKAAREGKVAAEVIANHPSAMDNRAIPAVVFTDPEIAWTGLTEREAKEEGITVNVGKFPLTALGRARSLGRTDGFVKILSDPDTNLILGVGIVGTMASELIAEGTLAIEMGATLEDLMVTIHPHPTLSESLMEAAEVAAGSPTHILTRKLR